MARLVLADREATVIQLTTIYSTEQCCRMHKMLKQHGGWATKSEDHLECHSCQKRTGIRGYGGQRLTDTKQLKTRQR